MRGPENYLARYDSPRWNLPVMILLALTAMALLTNLPLEQDTAQYGPVKDTTPDQPILGTVHMPHRPMRTSTRAQPEYTDMISYDDVLVVRNLNSPLSMQIADYFQAKRNIPAVNICNITTSTAETVNRDVFDSEIRTPVEDHLINNNLLDDINYFVTTKDVPLRISEVDTSDDGAYAWDRACVDSDLALILGLHQGAIGQPYWYNNPYFNPDPYDDFEARNYSFFLVTRLTGYDWEDIKSIIDKPELAIGRQGTVVLDVDPGRDGGGYQVGNDWMRNANATLAANGFDVYLDETDTFLTNQVNASGYTSWGSNDGHYPTNSQVNSGLENDGNADGVPDGWYFENEGSTGFCERNGTEVWNGAWSVRMTRNSTGQGATFLAQNHTIKPDTRYYAVGYVNLSGVSADTGVHLQFRAFDSQGNIVQYYNGSARTGTTGSWVSLYQKHFEPIEGVTRISVGVALTESSGTVFVDDIYLYEIKPHNGWVPGAIVETYVSTGGRSFNYPTSYGQSLVADLIRDGVTGTKGYVYEPFLDACAHPDILFDAYTQGFNLAESYYMASEYVSWMDVVVGDPKLAPYKKSIIPDLEVNPPDITLSTDMPLSGEVVEIHVTVSNRGPASTSEVEVLFYLERPGNSSVFLGSRLIDVEGLGTNTTSSTWDTTGYLGDFNISVIVDTQDRYYESNESNNAAKVSVTAHTGFPEADAGPDASRYEDEIHVFDGAGSTSNSSITNYTWDFGDGTLGYGPTISHVYTSQSLYIATLNVTNAYGVWGTDTVIINVSNAAPVARAGDDVSGEEATTFLFNASMSSDTPSDMGSLNYSWDFGDGHMGYGPTEAHVYADDGVYPVTLIVRDDDGAIDTDNVDATVVNVPPWIAPVAGKTAIEDEMFTMQVIAGDVPADPIMFSDNSSLFEIDPGSGEIAFTPSNGDVGRYLINITVSDGDGGVNYTTFALSVQNTNDPPSIVSTPVTAATENTPYTYQVVVSDDDLAVDPFEEIAYSLDLAPQGMVIDYLGLVTWEPEDHHAYQNLEVIVNATDGELYDVQAFTVSVANINDVPVIISKPPTYTLEDELYNYVVNATDADIADVLTFALDTAPGGMTIDHENGVISWLPENDDVGHHDVTVRVTDGQGTHCNQSFTVTVENVNDPPVLQPIGSMTATEDVLFSFRVTATDVDFLDELTFQEDSDLFEIDPATGNVSFTPTNDDVGTYTVTFSVSDGGRAVDSEIVTLAVLNVNDPPVLDFVSDMLVLEDEAFLMVVSASDIDSGDTLAFRDDTPLFDIDSDSGEIAFTPTNDDVGLYTVNISVMDGSGAYDSQEVAFIVQNVNDPPEISLSDSTGSSTEFDLVAGEFFFFKVDVSDMDADDELTFSDDTYLFDIDPAKGEIAFTPSEVEAGTHRATVTVTDSGGGEDSITLTFHIEAEEEEEAPDSFITILLVIIITLVVIIELLLILARKRTTVDEEPAVLEEFVLEVEESQEEEDRILAPMVSAQEEPEPQDPRSPPMEE